MRLHASTVKSNCLLATVTNCKKQLFVRLYQSLLIYLIFSGSLAIWMHQTQFLNIKIFKKFEMKNKLIKTYVIKLQTGLMKKIL